MWSNGEDVNDHTGEPIYVYDPIDRFECNKHDHDPTYSFVGGCLREDEDHGLSPPPVCAKCQEAMHLMLRLNDPYNMEQSMCVFGCNRAACGRDIFQNSVDGGDYDPIMQHFCLGGGGVFDVRRIPCAPIATVQKTKATTAATTILEPQQKQPQIDLTDNDWGLEDDDWNMGDSDDDVVRMEAMVAAVENMTTTSRKSNTSSKKNNSKTGKASCHSGLFPCFIIDSYPEPSIDLGASGNDEDDVGMADSHDDKIQKMLTRYMTEEEDHEILTALEGGSSSGGGGGGSRGERDERLSAEDRALFVMTDRIKRAPHQVLRYAKGGIPMWSIPTKHTPGPKQNNTKDKNRKDGVLGKQFPQIPKCACGAERVFEFQLMPGLLHALEVDKQAQATSSNTNTNSPKDDTREGNPSGVKQKKMLNDYHNGGMNWGTIAVYTCRDSCVSGHTNEFLIVQNSIEGTIKQRVAIDPIKVEEKEEDGDENEKV